MSLDERDLRDLEKAVKLLEQNTITETITQVVGKPIDYLMDKLPKGVEEQIHSLVETALHKAADAALWSLDNEPNREASTKTNKIFAAVSGAVGGAFGFTALAIELPISTTIMLRSVADIARSEGFDLNENDTKTACLEVFALGGPSEDDDAVDTAYYATRNFTAEAMQVFSKEITEIAAKQASKTITPTQTGKWLAALIEKIAARFGVVITEKAAAQAVPIIGAFAGATLNTMFTDYYQDMARGHFIIKRLENKYDPVVVKAEYMKISNQAMTLQVI
ncbi:peptidase [Vibrio parahaemolyticus]|uniref:EcsC family protein n=1 Tax=Vibrio parahaemolyticus TaxID=670 RepID=UPI0010AA9A66|nr:EcsC family protein [Vibrio parahaemolyticus]THE59843.1 EcsC family protein [Vibrio parahaemolyticus]TOK23584.1 peptidase [Vibrio parahaemolyticus]